MEGWSGTREMRRKVRRLPVVGTRSTASHSALDSDAFRRLPLVQFGDAVERVLTDKWDAVERVPTNVEQDG